MRISQELAGCLAQLRAALEALWARICEELAGEGSAGHVPADEASPKETTESATVTVSHWPEVLAAGLRLAVWLVRQWWRTWPLPIVTAAERR
jgi:hypothetical protein